MINCYSCPARLFINGGKEIASKEGTTQGGPLEMALCAIGLTPLQEILVHILLDNEDNTKMVAFADDLTGVGQLRTLKDWWKTLWELGPKFGYYPQPTKYLLVVKERYKEESTVIFAGSNIQITSTGQRHQRHLSEIALIEPQAAYASYVSGFQHKFTYFIRTIKGFELHAMMMKELYYFHLPIKEITKIVEF